MTKISKNKKQANATSRSQRIVQIALAVFAILLIASMVLSAVTTY